MFVLIAVNGVKVAIPPSQIQGFRTVEGSDEDGTKTIVEVLNHSTKATRFYRTAESFEDFLERYEKACEPTW